MKSKRKQAQAEEIEAMRLTDEGEIVIEAKDDKPKAYTYEDYEKSRAKRQKKQVLIKSSHR
jgi:hypothetical protein